MESSSGIVLEISGLRVPQNPACLPVSVKLSRNAKKFCLSRRTDVACHQSDRIASQRISRIKGNGVSNASTVGGAVGARSVVALQLPSIRGISNAFPPAGHMCERPTLRRERHTKEKLPRTAFQRVPQSKGVAVLSAHRIFRFSTITFS